MKRQSIKKKIEQHLTAVRYNLNKLLDHDIRKACQTDDVYRFSVMEGLQLSSVDNTELKVEKVP